MSYLAVIEEIKLQWKGENNAFKFCEKNQK